MASIKDSGSITGSVRCPECEVSSGSKFEEFGRALTSVVAADESTEDGCSSGQTKSGAYTEHRG
uniref:Uncharacterized protein n=1 Tax=Cucumis sativus TaxID=3659 RepID=A0A0A0L8S2_CUCSA